MVKNEEKPLLVSLDLDEALYYRAESLDAVTHRQPDLILPGALAPYLFLRPHAKLLLEYLGNQKHRYFGFFTASCGQGTNAAVKYLEELAGQSARFFFDRDRVIFRYRSSVSCYHYGPELEQVKDLNKVKRKTGFNIDDILAVDDRLVYPRQYGNVFRVTPYFAKEEQDSNDTTLLDLKNILEVYEHVGSIRHFLKFSRSQDAAPA